ncbi:Tetratricopeptide repeat-containing protein [Flagellimonas taeanensis]|uniref:Tetratricopeptide repeat-containing protein n=1 Tax=Flagellimonas taeanensis TaxID=1005926 RepID=A0A1I1ES84_9FLAO|nr:Tetratricopeptide repeat-containing protein [Allomuricauda taeanensis]
MDLKETNPFDIIIWVSAKTTMLTPLGVSEIENALRDFGGVIENISSTVGEREAKSLEERLKTILEYLEVFDVLLIIDNLETILDENIRSFIREASQQCKILITSRIGLGELEFRRPLHGMSEHESIQLVRSLANLKKSNVLNRLENQNLIRIINQLHYNPLALKWFVNSVETGASPSEVLNNQQNLLNFCLSNVYEKLSKNAIQIINTILASRKSLNDAELIFITNLTSLEMRRAMNELFATTFISRQIDHSSDQQEVKYIVPDFAQEYILRNHQISPEYIKSVSESLRQLNLSTANIKRVSGYNEFGVNAISITNSNEKVVGRLLNEALKYSRIKDVDNALKKVNEAKSILPNYFEVYRVGAFIKATYGDLLGAETDYKTGLSIAPDNPRLLYFYGNFLLINLNDLENAVEYAKKVYELRPESPYPTFLLTRILSTIGEYESAIRINEKLITDSNLNHQNIRIARTHQIKTYHLWGTEYIRKEGDFEKAKEKFKKGIKIFEECVQNNLHDEKLINAFVNTLKYFVQLIPKIQNEENVDFIKRKYLDYHELISQDSQNEYFKNLLKNAYGIELSPSPILKGRIEKIFFKQKFAFIRTKSKSYFAHSNDFSVPNEFDNLEIGTPMDFSVGYNSKGECAVDVSIHKEP